MRRPRRTLECSGRTLVQVFNGSGVAVTLGRELGRGGEGSVFEMPGHPELVAKLYHQPLDAAKQDKLHYMVSVVDAKLTAISAWPRGMLHRKPGGPVVGFVMPHVSTKQPMHKVYSPAHRKQAHPDAAWDFLVFVARNAAAAFEAIHAHGHVIGDVNQGNLVVGTDSRVVFIDCDSFQIRHGSRLYPCLVGVPHFTPPELQRVKNFASVSRGVNHDNFGLALIIFHLLFAGRHPYAGVPLNPGDPPPLESAIANFKFAYSRTAGSRGIRPPPYAPSLSLVPDDIAFLFERAFTESGTANDERPTAGEWVTALDRLRGRLKRCNVSLIHQYSGHLSACPWCGLERQGAVFFIDMKAVYSPAAGGQFHLARVWGAIQAVPAPGPLAPPDWRTLSVTCCCARRRSCHPATDVMDRRIAVSLDCLRCHEGRCVSRKDAPALG